MFALLARARLGTRLTYTRVMYMHTIIWQHVPSGKEDVMGLITGLAQPQVWVILMRSAGHFAGAVFKGYVFNVLCIPVIFIAWI